MNLSRIDEIDFSAVRQVLVRTSMDVPIVNGQVADDFRLRRSLETINFLRNQGVTPILIGHIGSQDRTLAPVVSWYEKHFPVRFAQDYREGHAQQVVESTPSGKVIIFENLRLHKEEKENDREFAADLASYAQAFVNEDFATAHRAHASVVTLPKLMPSAAGFNFLNEVQSLSQAFSPQHPFLFIAGGAKFATKAPLLRQLTQKADQVFVAGALMNPLLQARGVEVGKSLMPETTLEVSDLAQTEKIILPTDFYVAENTLRQAGTINNDEAILDIGPNSLEKLIALINQAKLVIWNGPLGYYEGGFRQSTIEAVLALANSSATSIVGGGDTLATIQEQDLENQLTFVSTGGGAMLAFLESEGKIPGVEVLLQR